MTEAVTQKIEDFFAQYRLRKYTKGQVLILNGDEASYIYHLVNGTAKQYDVTYRGDEIILNIYKPPAFFPMSLAINKTPNPYIYEAETNIEIRQAPADEVIAFIKANPDVMFDLLSRVYRGVDGVLGRVVQLMGGGARSRLIYELIIEAKRFGKIQDGKSCLLDINEKDLGARAGLSRETVSREIHKLKTEGIIDIHSKGILIKHLDELENKITREGAL
ncbi:hypothetical protein A2917_01810 [Candidatus Nomurabacteria bacterium RIFCSPLOWO2_01_FULL_42_17]|uniref:HTH crp-type domain-containing protein n=1 Tax=Candidatus Nomurabacteria bacterium RIFCSPLOWO2_01_FULL_42_17 TaxID=1801780 RepID=A0A1F6XLX8_9BACT|nr:MAG: hypothetical protein A2917_01810 [Candidatus Nomurabacteria bacterium RIFCSPLOWO2_01_FULL_42_17]